MTHSALRLVSSREWPINRAKEGTYHKIVAEQAEQQDRHVICGFCGKSSPLVNGPTGRAWFKAHKCHRLTVMDGGQQ